MLEGVLCYIEFFFTLSQISICSSATVFEKDRVKIIKLMNLFKLLNFISNVNFKVFIWAWKIYLFN